MAKRQVRKQQSRRSVAYTPFVRAKSVDSGNGGFQGYANVKGCMDSHGTIMIDGCYVAGIPDLIKKGFVPDTHGEATRLVPVEQVIVGFINDAKEDEYGLWVDCSFHGDEFSQSIRQKNQERMSEGKECGMSIGFTIDDSFIIHPKDYATELPKYLKPEFLQQGMADALNFSYIEICKKVTVMETSLTFIPSNTASLLTEVRSGKRSDTVVTQRGSLYKPNNDEQFLQLVTSEVLSALSDSSKELREVVAGDLRNNRSLHTIKEILEMATRALPEEHRDAIGKACDALEDAAKSRKRMRDAMDEADDHHRDMGKHLTRAAKHLDSMLKRDDDDDKRDDDKRDDDKRSGSSVAELRTRLENIIKN